ncbi:LytR/AlgR family response regulator transcription factor [Pyxidicoccus sp. MSG2]|uniref:LytR/AlgR family response regulator transcription factor n=1 Tax=Pyxidicoccus sp. MSG2 TaxID=2996790 RepID=UPI002270BDC4|nr:LytTR family DNA-binding domain-containing protein [Pyxidicoccus sp. MSG2]MCY1023872.1 LytTR family DNA-binding domain-containing protein [Pyxidicoccus sp. MSG2]
MSTPLLSERIRTLVVDDEHLARKSLRLLLSADPDIEVVGECATGRKAIQALQQGPVDLLFLDIQMPGVDGFEVLQAAGPGAASAVVFVTAFDTHALRAFDVGAIHYLLKPFDDARFASVLARAKAHVSGLRVQGMARKLGELCAAVAPAPAAPPALAPTYLERLAVKEAGRVLLVPVEQIDWAEAEDYYVQVHVGGRAHLLRQSLRELEAQLDPRRFLRIHRSTLVNLERVKELQPLFHGEFWVLLHDGRRLKLSRSYRDRLDQVLSVRRGREPPLE